MGIRSSDLRFSTVQPHDCDSETSQLRNRIVNYLYQRIPNLDELDVEVHQATVILSGRVPSHSDQWRCVDCCRHVAGVLNVIDRLVVVPDKDTSYSGILDDERGC